MSKFVIITSINSESECIKQYRNFKDWNIIVVGDKKSPSIKSSGNLTFISTDDQKKLNYSLIKNIPFNHYCRKNIGYIYAIKNGADMIYDTDDDNIPYDFWQEPKLVQKESICFDKEVFNICPLFSKEKVWCRGLPLDIINNVQNPHKEAGHFKLGIVQTLADKDPDVDAIYRLTINKPIIFDKNISICLSKNTYTPFNSQSTFWTKETFPYLYLPMFVNFRFTDILRSYIAQRLIWDKDLYLSYTSPIVYQERNPHNYIKDFIDEIQMYQGVYDLVDILKNNNFNGSLVDAYNALYNNLSSSGFITKTELSSSNLWMENIT